MEEQEIFDGQLDSHQTMYIWNSHNSKQNDTLTWWERQACKYEFNHVKHDKYFHDITFYGLNRNH